MQRDIRAILDGALGGVVGTAGMSAFMLAAGKAGLMGEHPPDTIAGAALDAVGVQQQDEEALDALAILLHFGFGVSCGTLFGLLHRRLPFRVPAALHGMVFASIIWVTSYQGWIPALGIMPPASEDRPDRPRVMLLAHLVYGAILGNIVARRSPPPNPLPTRERENAARAHH
ncbi:MAG TPA: DUF6789 family protein [Thermomicrobiales bacterium]